MADDLPAALAADLPAAFERLVLTHQGRLYAVALRLTGCPSDAEEIAQDALVRAYRALQRYPLERIAGLALRPWLYQIALNLARNHRRRRRPSATSIEQLAEAHGWEAPDEPTTQPEARLEEGEESTRLAGLLLGLPPRYRVAVVLRHIAGLPYAEVAAALGQPVGTVKANVHRGLRLLRAALAA